ncbi:hypothetical protein D3C85_1167860 [compost metagenome]
MPVATVEHHIGSQVQGQPLGQAGGEAGLQVELPAVFAQVQIVVGVVLAKGQEQVGRDAEVAAAIGIVQQPERHGQDGIGQAAAVLQAIAAIQPTEWQQYLWRDAEPGQVGVMHQAQHADLRIQPGRIGDAFAALVQMVALGALEIEQPQRGAGGGRDIVTGVQVQCPGGRGDGQAAGQQAEPPGRGPGLVIDCGWGEQVVPLVDRQHRASSFLVVLPLRGGRTARAQDACQLRDKRIAN